MDGEQDQRLVARGRDQTRDQHIGIDGIPPRGGVIAASVSVDIGRYQLVEPALLGTVPGFLSQSGGGTAVRIKSCTLMMTTGFGRRHH